MRGEYEMIKDNRIDLLELPPRARRILRAVGGVACVAGTTSACAENTVSTGVLVALTRNYLRVRGEYSACTVNTMMTRNYLRVRGEYSSPEQPTYTTWELPPRARRIWEMDAFLDFVHGTTSACAENTS